MVEQHGTGAGPVWSAERERQFTEHLQSALLDMHRKNWLELIDMPLAEGGFPDTPLFAPPPIVVDANRLHDDILLRVPARSAHNAGQRRERADLEPFAVIGRVELLLELDELGFSPCLSGAGRNRSVSATTPS